jgi:hypothetical protein
MIYLKMPETLTSLYFSCAIAQALLACHYGDPEIENKKQKYYREFKNE